MTRSFTIRVYGLLQHKGHILLSKERIKGGIYIKFPGGGLELGEGVVDALKREFMEEVGIELDDTKHFYTTEDFIPSAFDPGIQVISIYYLVRSSQSDQVITISGEPQNDRWQQLLYWCPLEEIADQDIELPLDKRVVNMLLSKK